MESRKMALMNLFAEQQGDTNIENRLMDLPGVGRKETVGGMERVTWKHTSPSVK